MQTSTRSHRSKSSRALDTNQHRQQQLANELGNVIRAGAVAQRLGISVHMVDQLRLAKQILAIPQQNGYVYPCWQFEGRGLLSGLLPVLTTLKTYDAWSQLAFLTTPNPDLVSQRPLDTLRHGEIDAVVMAAQHYAAQQAANN